MGFHLGYLGMTLSGVDETSVDSITLFVLLLCSCILIGHLLEKSRWMTVSITALVIGLCTGIVILLTTDGQSSRILVFNEDLFFIYLLPPIIFNAGFVMLFLYVSILAINMALVSILFSYLHGQFALNDQHGLFAAFGVKRKQFFQNFVTIILFGAVGSLISFVIIWLGTLQLFKYLDTGFLEAADYLALGAIFSATDSVCTLQVLNHQETPLLYSLVFGEGVVNDATSVVLFHAIQKFDLSHITSTIAFEFVRYFLYLFLTSTILGVAVGLLSAYLIKKLYFGRHSTDREVALMILMAYFSYMVAELFDLSGILTVFFCGIVMAHYTWYNITENSRVTTRHTFATFSFVSEIFIFLYVGMDAIDIEKWKVVSKSPGTSVGVSSILLVLALVGRAAFVFPLSFISNLMRKSRNEKIGFKQQVTIWWAGLIRGAVSIALAYRQFTLSGHTQQLGNAIMITSTITVVLFTTVVGGLLTKPLVRLLLPQAQHRQSESSMISSESSEKALSLPLLTNGQDPQSDVAANNIPRPTSLRMLLSRPYRSVHHYWRMFDDAYMRPAFGGRGFVPQTPGSPIEGTLH